MSKAAGSVCCCWCGKEFAPRRDGGKPQVFCRPACRRAFDSAGRRWVAEAIGARVLTVDALKKRPAATRALVPAASSPVPDPAPVPPGVESRYAAQEYLEAAMARAIALRRR